MPEIPSETVWNSTDEIRVKIVGQASLLGSILVIGIFIVRTTQMGQVKRQLFSVRGLLLIFSIYFTNRNTNVQMLYDESFSGSAEQHVKQKD